LSHAEVVARGRKAQFPHSDTSKRSHRRVNLGAPVPARVGTVHLYMISLLPTEHLELSQQRGRFHGSS